MELKEFKSHVKIIDRESCDTLRNNYINRFVNTTHPLYVPQIQTKHKFVDGLCYLGYLLDYIKNPIIVEEPFFDEVASKIKTVYAFWDIHSCERILIKNYWKFGKETVLKLNFQTLLEGEDFLPEDIYIFDDSMTWTLIKTHEDIQGKRYCLKSGDI